MKKQNKFDKKHYNERRYQSNKLGVPLNELNWESVEKTFDAKLCYDTFNYLERIKKAISLANNPQVTSLKKLEDNLQRVLVEHMTQKKSTKKSKSAKPREYKVNSKPITGKDNLPPIPYQTDRIYLASEQIPIPEHLEKYELSEHGVVTLTTIGYNNLTQDLKELWFIQLRNQIANNHDSMCEAKYKDYTNFSMDYDYDLHCEPKIYYMLWQGMDLGNGVIKGPPYIPKPECGSLDEWDPENLVGV